MKRNIWLAALALIVLMGLMSGCKSKDTGQNESDGSLPDGSLPGGYSEDKPRLVEYSEDREPTEEDLAIFDKVMSDLDGASYEPTLVATQDIAGVTYRFTVTATPDEPDPESYTTYIYIYKPSGSPPNRGGNAEAEN